jgi:hypothetical protein
MDTPTRHAALLDPDRDLLEGDRDLHDPDRDLLEGDRDLRDPAHGALVGPIERELVEPAEGEDTLPAIVGPIPERHTGSAPHWEPIQVDEYDNLVDGSAIEGKTGNYLFTVGNVGSGKSTIQSYLIHRLWSDSRILFEYATTDGNPAHDAYLNGWVQNIGNGFFPGRTKAGHVREFTVRFGQAKRPALQLSFIEIAGEEIRSIVPTGNDRDRQRLGLNEHLERFLKEPRIKKRFLFVSDGSANRMGPQREAAMYNEDILFDTLLRYLLSSTGVGLKRIEALFVAAKWDQIKNDYRSERHYFRTNFPQTFGTVASTSRIRASFMPFSVGDVVVGSRHAGGESVARIARKEPRYIDTLISWIYQSFTQRRLVGHSKVRRTLWDKLKAALARLGG